MIIAARVSYPVAWLLVALALANDAGHVLLFAGLGLQGLAAGVEIANEMGYWQTLTPERLLGRVNATRRSINRTLAAVGALLGGLLVGLIGERLALTGAIVGFLVAALSPLRTPTGRDADR